MTTAAVIVAAGLTGSENRFQPMLNVGSISISQRIIATLKQAGVTRIAVVTGSDAQKLERQLAQSGVVFLRNEDDTAQMFDSAKIGFEYLQGKFDRVVFTPVNVPMFSAETVKKLLKTGAELVSPVCNGKAGHPIVLSVGVIAHVLTDSGEGGLRGALSRCGIRRTLIDVDDDGILTRSDACESLLQQHNSRLTRPVVELSLAREKSFFDARISTLLSLIDETGSVRLACTRMQISYSTGWHILNSVEEELHYPVITRTQGGSTGGSSALTPEGRKLMETYNRFEAAAKQAVEALYETYFPKGGVL